MKDIGSTAFGYLIAFLLPGLLCIMALAYWVPGLMGVLATFSTAESNLGLTTLLLLAALAVGLQLCTMRWVLFERVILRETALKPSDFEKIGSESRLAAFRAAVDELYRFHQFWGSMAFVLPLGYLGWGRFIFGGGLSAELWCAGVALALEILTVWAAIAAYERSVKRSKSILKGG